MNHCYVVETREQGSIIGIYTDEDKAIEVAKYLNDELSVRVVKQPLNVSAEKLKEYLVEIKEKEYEKYLKTPSKKYSEQLMKDLINGKM